MKDFILTTDSGMCPPYHDDIIVLQDQITDSLNHAYKDNEVNAKDIILDQEKIYKTSAPLLTDYVEEFSKILDSGKDVIHISLGSGISSSSVNNANMVANELNEEYENKVHVIDSQTGSVGGTMYFERSYQMIMNSNLSIDEKVKKLEELKKKVKTFFYVPDPTGFIRSGRDNSKNNPLSQKTLTLSSKLLKMIALKFRVDFDDDGKLYLNKIFRSNNKKGMLNMVKEIVNDNTIENYEKELCVIGNLFQKDVDMNEIKKYLDSFGYFDQIIYSNVGNVVAPYGCNDLCGLSLIKK